MPPAPKNQDRTAKPRRLGVADAKSRLAEVLRDADRGVTVIHRRGRDIAVVLSIDEYGALLRRANMHRGRAGNRLVTALADWRAEHAGVDFEPEPARIVLDEFPSKAR